MSFIISGLILYMSLALFGLMAFIIFMICFSVVCSRLKGGCLVFVVLVLCRIDWWVLVFLILLLPLVL
jgi:hypothetical protein